MVMVMVMVATLARPTAACPLGQEGRWNSCVLDTFPSAPPPTRKFRREAAKARAALHAKVEAHLNSKVALPWPDRALAPANWHKSDRVSSDHRPPTSPAKTTIWPERVVPSTRDSLASGC